MTKKHFVQTASALYNARPLRNHFQNGDDFAQAYRRWVLLVNDLCEICKAANPNFDKARFTSACGLTGPHRI